MRSPRLVQPGSRIVFSPSGELVGKHPLIGVARPNGQRESVGILHQAANPFMAGFAKNWDENLVSIRFRSASSGTGIGTLNTLRGQVCRTFMGADGTYSLAVYVDTPNFGFVPSFMMSQSPVTHSISLTILTAFGNGTGLKKEQSSYKVWIILVGPY